MDCAPRLNDRHAVFGERQERVSVIIPTRNRPDMLRSAVESLLLQTRPVQQIIAVDDSSDSTDWTTALTRLSPSIEIVRSPSRGGAAAARNLGLERARGDHIIFLDDDDLLDPRFVERGLAVLAENRQVDGVFFRFRTLASHEPIGQEFTDTLPFRVAFAANPVPRATLEQCPFAAFLRYLVPICSCLLRRSAVGSIRFAEELAQGEDTFFWISLVAAGRRFVLDDHAYAIVRRHADNTTRSLARYMSEIQPCYEKLLASGLLPLSEHAFLAHLKLLCFKLVTGKGGRSHLGHVLGSPRQLAAEARFWAMNVGGRALRSLGLSAER